MRDYAKELLDRVSFIRGLLESNEAKGIVYGNSGGKDSALVGILCKTACANTVGLTMPCSSKRNYEEDMADALEVAKQFSIETRTVDLTAVKETLIRQLEAVTVMTAASQANIAPRLRMTTLYGVAASEGRLVAGTGNRTELYLGYFTKWGDGACDFNPISDLTVQEIYEFLAYLGAPSSIRTKAPSAGLFEGQTDEGELGIRYATVDRYLLEGKADEQERDLIERYHERSEHKRNSITVYKAD